jgi:hypothetical protein
MVLSPYQVNNVLRVYGDQLRQHRVSAEPEGGNTRLPDKISIAAEAKRKAIVDNVASNIIERITRYGPHEDVEKEVFQKFRDEYGANLAVAEEGQNDLIFKLIDENGETMSSISIEDSNFLRHKLEEIAKDTVDKTMM